MIAPRLLESAAEEIVVKLAISGNEDAFEELVRRKQSYIRNLLRRLTNDAALADDLSQQVFMKCWLNLNSLRTASSFSGWLKMIAINTWQKSLRHTDALKNVDEEWPIESEVTQEFIGEEIDLDTAMSTLPTNVRLCIVLSYKEGMSHTEIAELTHFPLGTIKSHIKRGSAHLQKLLASYNENNPK